MPVWREGCGAPARAGRARPGRGGRLLHPPPPPPGRGGVPPHPDGCHIHSGLILPRREVPGEGGRAGGAGERRAGSAPACGGRGEGRPLPRQPLRKGFPVCPTAPGPPGTPPRSPRHAPKLLRVPQSAEAPPGAILPQLCQTARHPQPRFPRSLPPLPRAVPCPAHKHSPPCEFSPQPRTFSSPPFPVPFFARSPCILPRLLRVVPTHPWRGCALSPQSKQFLLSGAFTAHRPRSAGQEPARGVTMPCCIGYSSKTGPGKIPGRPFGR